MESMWWSNWCGPLKINSTAPLQAKNVEDLLLWYMRARMQCSVGSGRSKGDVGNEAYRIFQSGVEQQLKAGSWISNRLHLRDVDDREVKVCLATWVCHVLVHRDGEKGTQRLLQGRRHWVRRSCEGPPVSLFLPLFLLPSLLPLETSPESVPIEAAPPSTAVRTSPGLSLLDRTVQQFNMFSRAIAQELRCARGDWASVKCLRNYMEEYVGVIWSGAVCGRCVEAEEA